MAAKDKHCFITLTNTHVMFRAEPGNITGTDPVIGGETVEAIKRRTISRFKHHGFTIEVRDDRTLATEKQVENAGDVGVNLIYFRLQKIMGIDSGVIAGLYHSGERGVNLEAFLMHHFKGYVQYEMACRKP